MKHPFTKTEITGLIFLCVLVVGITGIAFLLKSGASSDKDMKEDYRVTLYQEEAPDTLSGVSAKKRKVKKRGSKGKSSSLRSSSRKSSSKRKSSENKAIPERRDPFSDTIPVIQ